MITMQPSELRAEADKWSDWSSVAGYVAAEWLVQCAATIERLETRVLELETELADMTLAHSISELAVEVLSENLRRMREAATDD